MTGHQPHPGTGTTLKGQPAPAVDLETLCRGLGVEHVCTVDPHDLKATRQAVKEAVKHKGPSVVITRRPCVLLPESRAEREPLSVDQALCTACGACLDLGCPAIVRQDNGRAFIQQFLCTGCGLCLQVCPKGAMS
jgi:indolepyruvate ferredoxin oxidoreductase alpha subunit